MNSPSSFQVEVPKSHPGLPRLLEAAKGLPELELVKSDGINIKKRQLFRLGAYEEFFDALGEIIGKDHADDMLAALLPRNRLQDASPEALMDLAKNLKSSPLLGMLKMFGR